MTSRDRDKIENGNKDGPPSRGAGWLSRWSYIVVAGLILMLSVVACKNISYSLLWNDEAETIMTAQQIMTYGYPKVHNAKNEVFIPDNSEWIGYKPSADANITMTWGCYYYAVIGVWLARFTDDIYMKTALVRLPFVMAGLLGLGIFALTMRRFFSIASGFRIFVAAFLIAEILSVNFLLHIREARYYSLVVLISAMYFYVFAAYHFHSRYSKNKYTILLTAVLVVAFNINFIAFATMCITTLLYQCYAYFKRQKQPGRINLKESALLLSPLLIAGILACPELVFFDTVRNARLADAYYHNGIGNFYMHVRDIMTILFSFEWLPAMIILKLLKIGYEMFSKNKGVTNDDRLNGLEAMSVFMILFFIVYTMMAARMPFLFTRYFVVLQPVLILMLLTDMVIILEYIALSVSGNKTAMQYRFITLATCICLVNTALSENHIADYCYQISHRYRGPLDYYIAAIQQRYPHPEDIIVATNYEEMSYEYYLDCKVIWAYQNHFQSFDKDSSWKQTAPDVIISRPGWQQDNRPYEYFLQHGRYMKISFPVQDLQVNNVPELYYYLKHRFRTAEADTPAGAACMYVKE